MKLLSEKTTLTLKDWKTTATGIILALVTILATIGVLTPEQSTGIRQKELK